MIWINLGERSYQATAVNIAEDKDDKYSLWIERTNGSGVKVLTGTFEEMEEHKQAIDFAVSKGFKTYEISN